MPYVDYEESNRKGKFFCGIVLQVNDMQYYVPVSSSKGPHEHTYYLYDGRRPISSLRFDYMFPVPQELISIKQLSLETDVRYGDLLAKELNFCRQNESYIREHALRTYIEVLAPQKENQLDYRDRSCNFRLLETACRQYCREHGITLEPHQVDLAQPVPGSTASPAKSLKAICANAKAKAAEINAEKPVIARQPERERE